MDLVLIGSGNVAAVLGRKFIAAGHHILQIVGRNASAASELAYEWDTVSTNYLSAINRSADVYLIAVPDDQVKEVAKDLQLPDRVVAHTAASVSMNVLAAVTPHHGVFYPLQSLRRDMTVIPEIPIFFQGSDALARRRLEKLAFSISGRQAKEIDEDHRSRLHVAAVTVNNFTNHLFALAEDYCRKEGLEFRHLLPLIEETITRLRQYSPAALQTGPAVRHDDDTVRKHLEILNAHPRLKKIYQVFTESIRQG
ncbi:MAG TPA: F420-dependent NADP oxidoreductase [Chitinophagaceae bacterium]|nr:F420-dependent NADP oxidoreductase [Chitinophagaceae bacterium]